MGGLGGNDGVVPADSAFDDRDVDDVVVSGAGRGCETSRCPVGIVLGTRHQVLAACTRLPAPVLQFGNGNGNSTELTDPLFDANQRDIVDQMRAILVVAAGTL